MNYKVIFLLLAFLFSFTDTYSQLQWRTFSGGPTVGARFDDVFFINNTTGWIVDGGGRIIKTTNGGFNWVTQVTLTGRYCRAVGFADSLNGWVGILRYSTSQPDEILYRTTNGGVNWTLVQNIPQPYYNGICGIYVVSPSVIYASGSIVKPAVFIKSTDGGSSWQTFSLNQYAGFLIDCYFKDENTGFVVGASDSNINIGKPVVLYTTNGGVNWAVNFTGSRTNEWCWKINFISSNIGFISVERFSGSSIFLKTTDSGLSWSEKPFLPSTYDQEGIGFLNENTGWIGGWGGPTYQTTNGGLNWLLAGFGENINRFRFLSDTLAYAVGKKVYKFSSDVSIGINNITTSTPQSFELKQNYPNPFNPTTTIEFELLRPSKVKLSIYDYVGKYVITLFDDFQPIGSYNLKWNGINDNGNLVSSGIYFYTLETQYFIQTKKMVFIK